MAINMYIGMRAHDLPERDIVSLCDKLDKLDIREIQLALPKSIENIDFSIGKFTPHLARSIKKELDKKDISVAVLGCYISPCLEDDILRKKETDRFVEFLRYAKYINADMVGTETPGFNSEKKHSEKAYKIFLDSLNIMLENAQKLGVRVGIEGVESHVINSVDKIARLLNDVKSPNLAIIFDPVNLISVDNYKNQHEIIDRAFELFGDKIEAIHIKDFNIVEGEKTEVKMFDGIFDYEYLIKRIKDKKPYLTVLVEGESEKTFPNIRERLLKI